MALKKILVIDDEERLCRILKQILPVKGPYEVFSAHNGVTGRRMVREVKPDLILMDIVMPELSGSELAEELQENSQTASIPVIFITAVVSKAEMEKSGGRVGNRTFVAKPIDVDHLVARIKEALNE